MKHLLIVLFIAGGSILSAQPYLNKVYSNFGGAPDPAMVMEDSSYSVVSMYILDLNELHFGRFNLSGNLIHTRQYQKADNYIPSNCSKCFKIKNSKYYFAHTNFVKLDSSYVTFWKLNRNFDTIYTRKYLGFDNRMPDIYDMKFDSDSTFLVSGYLYYSDFITPINATGNYDLWVAKLDTAFNVIWQNRVEDNFQHLNYGYVGENLTIDDYGGVVVSGRATDYIFTIDTHHYSVAARFDRETGNLKWVKDFMPSPGSDHFAIADNGDGTYRFAQRQFLRIVPRMFSYADSSQLRFGAMDTLGNILWDTMLGPKYGQFHFRDLQHTTDGNYYLAGEHRVPPWDRFSSGFKISPGGDSLWLRTYLHYDSADVSHIWSFQETPDSGFVHFGLYGDEDFDLDPTRLQYSWLLKTDKYGCEVKDCHTISLPEVRPTQYDVSLYPNPNSGTFLMEIPEESFKKDLRIMVYNTAGVQVYASPLKRAREKIALTNVPPGLYMLNLLEDGKVVYGQKFVMQ